MDNEMIKDKILSGKITLSRDEIKHLIELEVQKDEDEIDIEFLDNCFEMLDYVDESEKEIQSKKPVKAVIVAAAVLIVLFSTVTVSANIFNFNIPQTIARFINGNAQIDFNLKIADTTAEGYLLEKSDLANQFNDAGISPVTFPEKLTTECEITNFNNTTTNQSVSTDVYVEFYLNDMYGNLSVIKYSENIDWEGKKIDKDVVSGQLIHINGLDVLIFECKNSCIIHYRDNLTDYNIYLESDIDTAIEFAKTIK